MIGHIDTLKKIKDSRFWEYVIRYKSELTVVLDNDQTYVRYYIETEYDEDEETVTAPHYLGNSKGIKQLLESLGVHYEDV